MKYPSGLLGAYENGCVLDMRFRVAIDLARAVFTGNAVGEDEPKNVHDFVERMFSDAEARGWIEPLPADGAIDDATRNQMERMVAAEIHKNATGQYLMSKSQGVKK